MKKNAKIIGYIIGVIVFVSMILGVTYAMYRKTLYDVNITSASNNLDSYVVYTKGANISSGTLNPTSNYTNGESATITFYQSSTCPYNLYGHIYFDINTMTLGASHILKYKIVDNSNSSVVVDGSFYTHISGSSILAAANIPLHASETTYTIYVWVDEELYDSSIASDGINIDIRCTATIKTIADNSVDAPIPSANTAANYIKYLYDSNPKSTATVNNITYNLAPSIGLMNDRHASMDTAIDAGDIRYYGANPNNYVWLGDTFETDYTYASYNGKSVTKSSGSKKLWRIIGFFGGRIKLIQNDPIGTIILSWDTSAASAGGNGGSGINEWSQADIMKLLNPGYENDGINNSLYWNKSVGTVYYGWNNITRSDVSFANTGLSSFEKSLIDTATWYLGANTTTSSYVDVQYAAERQSTILGKICTQGTTYCNDTVTRTSAWNGKVGLMYTSDYGYAADLSKCNYSLFNYNNANCTDVNWLYNSSFSQWTMSPYALSSYANAGLYVTAGGSISSGKEVSRGLDIRPAIYLKPEVVITGGTGTEADPYVLTLN